MQEPRSWAPTPLFRGQLPSLFGYRSPRKSRCLGCSAPHKGTGSHLPAAPSCSWLEQTAGEESRLQKANLWPQIPAKENPRGGREGHRESQGPPELGAAGFPEPDKWLTNPGLERALFLLKPFAGASGFQQPLLLAAASPIPTQATIVSGRQETSCDFLSTGRPCCLKRKGCKHNPLQHALGLQLRSLLPAQFALGSKLVSSLVLHRRFLPCQG